MSATPTTSAVPPPRTGTSYPEQAPIEAGSGLIYLTFFSDESIKRLTSADFALASKDKVAMVWDNCLIVLFYGENKESKDLMRIFLIAARQSAGIVFGACNLISEREVARAFVDIGNGAHPFHWARLQGYPFIMVYRKGYPAAFYNGDRSVSAILNWSQTMACKDSYFERTQLAAGVQAEATYQMPPYDPYGHDPRGRDNPLLSDSSQFRTDAPIRGYDPNLPITYESSAEATRVAERLRAAEAARAQRGGVLFPSTGITPAPGTAEALPRPEGTVPQPEAPIGLPTVVPPNTAPARAVPPPGRRTTPRTVPR